VFFFFFLGKKIVIHFQENNLVGLPVHKESTWNIWSSSTRLPRK